MPDRSAQRREAPDGAGIAGVDVPGRAGPVDATVGVLLVVPAPKSFQKMMVTAQAPQIGD